MHLSINRNVLPGVATRPISGGSSKSIEAQSGLARLIAVALVFFFVLALFLVGAIATNSDSQARSQGNTLNQIMILGMVLACFPLLVHRLSSVAMLISRTWPILALLCWFGLTAAWATYPSLTLRRAGVYFLIYLIGLGVAASCRRPSDFQRPLMWGLLIVCATNLVASLLGPAAADGAHGLLSHKNVAGALAALTVVAIAVTTVENRKLIARVALLPALAATAAFLVETKCKTCLGITVLVCVALPLIFQVLVRRTAYRTIVLTLLLGAAAVTLLLLALFHVSSDDVVTAAFGDPTFTSRTYLWQALLQEIAKHPIIGHGFGSFWETGQSMNPITDTLGDDMAWFASADLINEGHNGYLDAVLQTGLVGLALEFLVMARCVVGLSRAVRATGFQRRERIACVALLGIALVLFFDNLMESFLFFPSGSFGYLFLLIAVQAERWSRDAAKQTSDPLPRVSAADRAASLPSRAGRLA